MNLHASPTWKNWEAPAGTNMDQPQIYRNMIDCPVCKKGTLLCHQSAYDCEWCKVRFERIGNRPGKRLPSN